MRIKTSREEERRAVETFLTRFPDIAGAIDARWKERALNTTTPRTEIPPLFWFLVNDQRAAVIAEALQLLSEDRSIGPVIKELQLPDWDQLNSLLRELEVYRILRLQNAKVIWKPALPGKKKRPDLAVEIQDRKVYIEVFAITASAADRREACRFSRMNDGIDDLIGNPYHVSYAVEGGLSDSDIEPCLKWLQERISTISRGSEVEIKLKYPANGKAKIKFTLKLGKDGMGRFISAAHGVREIKESKRAKNKFLDKLDKFQFPTGTNDAKGYVVVLEAIFLDYEEVLSGVLGTAGVEFSRLDDQPTARTVRGQDGVVHDPTRGVMLREEIDFVAVFNAKGGLLEGKPEVLLNGGPGKLTGPDIEKLFAEKEQAP